MRVMPDRQKDHSFDAFMVTGLLLYTLPTYNRTSEYRVLIECMKF